MSYAQHASARPRFARQTPNSSGGDSRMPSRPPALEVHALEVRFGAARILQGVDLRLESGLLAVVGRNGMGETALCNAIMALVPHHGGSIMHEERILTQGTPEQIENDPQVQAIYLGQGDREASGPGGRRP